VITGPISTPITQFAVAALPPDSAIIGNQVAQGNWIFKFVTVLPAPLNVRLPKALRKY